MFVYCLYFFYIINTSRSIVVRGTLLLQFRDDTFGAVFD